MVPVPLHLTENAVCASVPLSAAQRAVVERPAAAGHLLVVGAPGSGKTATALATFRRRLAGEGRAGVAVSRQALLVPTRRAATALRTAISRERTARGAAGAPPLVQTVSAFAFGIVRAFAVGQGLPVPTLITGAQQDRILAEIIEGHALGAVPGVAWPAGLPPAALATAAFRHELRDLFMRASEFGLTPQELATAGRELERPEWEAAAALLAEYRAVVALGDGPAARGERYDSAAIVNEAALMLRDWEEFTDAPPPRFDAVVVDDYQESSAATVRLLHALVDRGATLTLFADPDVAVQTFRGARPQFVGRAGGADLGGFGAEVFHLPLVHRGAAGLRDVVRQVVEHVPSAGETRHRAAEVPAELRAAPAAGAGVRAVSYPSPAAEQAGIAHVLRSAHLGEGLPWDRQAVIVRSAAQQWVLAEALRAREVPVARREGGVVLRDERAVRPLLLAVEAAAGLDAQQATDLLLGPVGGFDPVSLRRLRRHVRARVRTGEFGVDASLDEALVQLLQTEGACTLPAEVADGAARVTAVLRAVREALTDANASSEDVLWRAWDATGLAGTWQRLALGGGPAGERADADLDAVMALFTAAESYSERNPMSRPQDFVAHIRAEELPSDTLAATGQRAPGVEVLTVAQAAGREWDLVVVAGVQEGSWPDTRVRDTLLGAGALADAELGRLGLGGERDRAAARREVVGDEWRLLAAAVSRARRHLVVTAVAGADQRPSAFFERVAGMTGVVAERAEAVERLDLRGLVATLRAELEAALVAGDGGGSAADARRARDAAALLAVLAQAGVQGADPVEWAGSGEPTSTAPLRRADRPVRVSPSKVESATTCPLRWALESVGGRSADRIEQTLGSLVHEIAALHPRGTREELEAALQERFDSLGLPAGWIRTRERERAEAMLALFAQYAASVPGTVHVEQEIEERVGDAVVHGFVDRVEVVDGGLRVADLKTGRQIRAADVERHAQLAVYQLALEARGAGVPAAGARLVYVTPERKSPAVLGQAPLPPGGGWARELLDDAVALMRSGHFDAVLGPNCRHCTLRKSCPVSDEGGRCAR